MSMFDKAKHAAEEAVGKAKQAIGDVKGDDELKAEGHQDEKKADAKQVGDDVKDLFNK